MQTTPRRSLPTLVLSFLILVSSLLAMPVGAEPYGDDPPPRCDCGACQTESGTSDCSSSEGCLCGGSSMSRSEGNLSQGVPGPALRGGSGSVPRFALQYDSYNADTSRARFGTVLGIGWTHTFNVFLYSVRGHLFRVDADGRITKFALGPGGSFSASPGHFETLVQQPGGFVLSRKDGTVYRFGPLAASSFMPGTPVALLQSITDRNGNVTGFSYSGSLLTQLTDPYNRTLLFTYNAQGKVQSITDPLGRVTTFIYDSSGAQLQQVVDPLGHATRFTYNTLFQLTRKTDRDGRVTTYRYANGRPVGITDGTGGAHFTLSNPGNWAVDATVLAQQMLRRYIPATTTKTDGRGQLWKYDYDANGHILKATAPDGTFSSTSYDPATLMPATRTDANGNTTSYQYDSRGNLTRVTNPLGHVTTYTYEPVFNQMTSRTDANNRITSYEYDSRGNRIKETDAAGATRTWSYDSRGNVTSETNKNGHTTHYLYDSNGNRNQITDALGNLTTMSYDAVGNLLTRTDANGHTTSYAYDALDRLVTTTDPAGKTSLAAYDHEGHRTQVTDRNGNPTQYQYDQRGRLIKTTDALGHTVTQTWDRNDNLVSRTDQNGRTTIYAYDVQNRRIRSTDALLPVHNVTTMTYDPVGNKLTDKDARGHVSSYQYDALNRLVRRTDAEANVTQIAYDGDVVCLAIGCPTKGSSKVTKQTDAEGKVTYFKYDALDRLTTQIRKQTDSVDVIDADDAVTRSTYDAQGNRLTLVDPNGNSTSYSYDVLDRQVRMAVRVDPLTEDITLTSYDPVGNIRTMTAPNLNVTTYTYDVLDRRIRVDDSVGLVGTAIYDNVGNRLSQLDGNGNGSVNAYDALNRIIKVTDALGHPTHYAYDPVGNLVQVTDRAGIVTGFGYDEINRRTGMTEAIGTPVQRSTGYRYDAVGNLSRVIDANGRATDYAYDKVNRMVRETYADSRIRRFAYDRVGNLKTRTDQKGQVTNYLYSDLHYPTRRDYPVSADDIMSYDLGGRVLSAERGGWLVSFAYDGANRITQTVQNGKTIAYSHDIPGRTRRITYPGGRIVTETGDLRGRLERIDDALAPQPIARYSHDPGDRVISRIYRNQTAARYDYNANNWILSLNHVNAGLLRIAGFGHAYENEGHKHFENKLPDPASSQTRSEAYKYDSLYRLIDYQVGTLIGSSVPVPLTQTQYALDAVGNWNVKTRDAVAESRTHSVTNEITQIGAVPVMSDLNGNTNEDALYRYDHDEENRLVRVSRKSDQRVIGRYEYDALGRRIKQLSDAATPSSLLEVRYFYDEARLLEEQDAAGATRGTWVYGRQLDEVLTMERAGQTHYYHQNSLGSVAAVTDAAAAVIERYAYDAYGLPAVYDGNGNAIAANPWGTPHSTIGNPWLFTGRQFDEESGLYHYRARTHDPLKGRFLQRDPLYDEINLYQYVGSSPPNYTDRYGLFMYVQNAGFTDLSAPCVPPRRLCADYAWSWRFELFTYTPIGPLVSGRVVLPIVGTELQWNLWIQHVDADWSCRSCDRRFARDGDSFAFWEWFSTRGTGPVPAGAPPPVVRLPFGFPPLHRTYFGNDTHANAYSSFNDCQCTCRERRDITSYLGFTLGAVHDDWGMLAWGARNVPPGMNEIAPGVPRPLRGIGIPIPETRHKWGLRVGCALGACFETGHYGTTP
ncbi:RHS repeat protein [Aquincola sp. S2]|uniref:RHS repeat protein n=1 Tax=Pseudaquabacterium terrae TaxID=2732868 RepID=A0ABX2EK06_9BURK|nr:RHS repeat protein [Aquabacterium terrae]NRF68874.1 RHS repeat protein [Aquabacterium terrae]